MILYHDEVGENLPAIKHPLVALDPPGCAALDMAYVAAGRYDGYFQNDLNIWDIAAGIILIKEAGGMINNIDIFNNKNIEVIASSTNIYAKLLEKLNNF